MRYLLGQFGDDRVTKGVDTDGQAYRSRGIRSPVADPCCSVVRQIGEIHELAAYALVGLASLHGLAARWHHFVRRDDVLRRTLPLQ
jgi:cytochrome b561